MAKISQILAVVGGTSQDVTAQLADLEAILANPDLFEGFAKTYRPRAEPQPGEEPPLQRPDQNKLVRATTDDILAKARGLLTRKWNLTRTLDEGKTGAFADVVIDGETILGQVTTDHLLYLEGELDKLHRLVSRFPVRDPADRWTTDGTEDGQAKGREVETTSSEPGYINHVLQKPEVIEGHLVAPIVQVMKQDVVVGFWTTAKLTGAMDARARRRMLDRITQLRDAMKYAREQANTTEVETVREGDEIWDFITA